ncbi:lytic transglycosylase domain-containing protein [Moraxella nasovis]|uniref:lytic transglycosylase domain-containing protein n=1 Tax=Moraxella nasovis TaxID=2904121 RepID=UPI001F61F8F4|nr:lytic transglycosylase domain-containing protein [Moraxella nasovis]UNU73726.1 lytic transglycosylase domain-containing protein [Moraxella nasovis]
MVVSTPKTHVKTICDTVLFLCIGAMALPLMANANNEDIYQFIDAERQKSNPTAMADYEYAMSDSLFAAYPTYWRLNYNLSSQSPKVINDFVHKYPSHVMSEKLAADYAETKARQGDYASVRAVTHSIENADESEACAIALGQNAIGDAKALSQKEDVWLNTHLDRSLCEKLATQMADHPNISNTDLENRLVRMLRIDYRQLSSKKPPLDQSKDILKLAGKLGIAIDYATILEIRQNPNGFLTRFQNEPYSQTNQYLYIYAISQIAHRSYLQAADQLNYDITQDRTRHHKLLSDMAIRYAWRSIAVKRMNMNTDDGFSMDAVNWFRSSIGVPFNYEESEDYAQAAIYFGQWHDVVTAISTMSIQNQQKRVWQYWLARSFEQIGKTTESRGIYQNLAKELDYYGLLAKDRLGQTLTARELGGTQTPKASHYDNQRVMQNPYFARAFLMMESGVSDVHAGREWNWAVKKARDTNDANLAIAAAKKAYDLGLYHRSIYAIDNMPNLRAAPLSHPLAYYDEVVSHSQNAGIDPAWAYGIIRQESRFQAGAKSNANAGGLMQIIPSTARLIAQRMGETAGSMNNPDTNIRYGTWYLNNLANTANGQIAVATASYNAGPNAAKKWLPKHGSIAADQYVEAIPYYETRDYVKHVMENATIYSSLLGRYTPISTRMGVVAAY